ncbi:serine/threonine-protein kinase [Streptomyces otsuchiensis]|uniref:serine/threonine-protein kinase n=1 Tax=Streptomyces otsuchiensis TaxID=2681388 RepID=UPI00102FE71D|nr:serine/threonine-protein kinase [Streptomyces otsuchiensis]
MTATVLSARYELVHPLGRGGMGEVWLGRDLALGGRKVAVKLLQAGRLASLAGTTDPDELRRRFLRESRATARIDHPGLVAVHDAGSEHDTMYLVMQLVDGSDLADHLAENDPYPWQWVVAVLAQVSSALVAVHAVGVVHRDLKPGNIMIRPDGRLTILDLGIAAVRGEDEETRLTRTGTMIGTPLYMAPEQALGGTTVGPAADLYALGTLGYELLAGETPFRAGDATGLLYKKLHEQPEPLATFRPDAPPALTSLLHRLLVADPQGRPADAQQLHAELAPLLPRAGVLADPPGRQMDPTRPYTHPLAPWPPRRSGHGAGAATGDPRVTSNTEPPLAAASADPRRTGPPGTAEVPRTGGSPAEVPVADLVEEAKRELNAGRSGPAAGLLRRALPPAGAQYGEDSTVVRTLRKQYAAALLDSGDYSTALPEVRLLLRAYVASAGPQAPVVEQLRADEQLCLRELGRV